MYFAYTAAVAFLIQWVVLPFVFPKWHAGNGLLVSGGDSLLFHDLAVELAAKIRSGGWGQWMLRPEGQAPAGIAAVFYALFVPKPWVLIPLNAALHASAGVVLAEICCRIFQKPPYVKWASLPFVVYPSSMLWYAQLHKDGYLILGAYLFVLGWLILSQIDLRSRFPIQSALAGGGWILGGATLTWIVRPYAVQMMQAAALIPLAIVAILFFRAGKTSRTAWRRSLGIGYLVLLILAMTPFTRGGIHQYSDFQDKPPPSLSGPSVQSQPVFKTLSDTKTWHSSSFLPTVIDDKIRLLALVRDRFAHQRPDAASNIDLAVEFKSAADLVFYFPRALEIVFFAPFVRHWFSAGSQASNTMMRKISGLEMIGIYTSYAFLLVSFGVWRRKPGVWIALSFALAMMLIYGLTICNVGTLYRMRYGFIMLWVVLGWAGLIGRFSKEA